MAVIVVAVAILMAVLKGNCHRGELKNESNTTFNPNDAHFSANDWKKNIVIDECYFDPVVAKYVPNAVCSVDYSYIEKYNQMPDNDSIKQFILKHRNERIREILAKQLRYCPYTALCSFSLNVSVPYDQLYSCCSSCSCDEYCMDTRTCCPDIIVQDNYKKNRARTTACIHMYMNLNMAAYQSRQFYGTFAVQYCPVGSTDSMCEQNYHMPGIILSFRDILPVAHLTTGIIYRNIHCALCNGVMEEELESFVPYVGCQYGSMPTYESESELIQFVLNSDTNCDIWFKSDSFALDNCETTISQCNVTGQWQTFDPLFVEACDMYASPIEMLDRKMFKNVFCAVCNGYEDLSTICPRATLYEVDLDFSFSGLLSYSKAERRSVSDNNCVKQPSDSRGECKRLYCSDRRLLVGDKCVRHLLDTEAFYYEITLLLTPNGNHSITIAKNDTDNVLDTLQHFILGQIRLEVVNSSDINVCSLEALIDTNGECNHKGDLDSPGDRIVGYYVRMTLYIKDLHDPESVLETIQNLQSFVVNSDTVREILQIALTNKYNLYLSSGHSSGLEDADCSRVTKAKLKLIIHVSDTGQCFNPIKGNIQPLIALQSLLICPLVNINNETRPWKINKNGITILDSNYNVNDRFFFYATDNDTVIFLCNYEYIKSMPKSNKRSFRITAEFIVSNVFTTLSIICLFITLVVFTMLKPLRNLPGKNNIALVSWLLIAQVCYTLGSYSPLYTNADSLACKIIGFLIHFSWLVAILWMNVCTYHVCRVMTKVRAIGNTHDTKKYMLYHVYCIIMAACFVTINMVVSSVTSDNSGIGYGSAACYISLEKMKLFTFVLPVGVVIVSNLVMFLIVVIRISRGSTVRRNVQNERNELAIFAKLSTLTGLTWIFGYVHIWTQFAVFNYVFIVLNAGQGVFLMVALVCNRRVIGMLRKTYSPCARVTYNISGQVTDTVTTTRAPNNSH